MARRPLALSHLALASSLALAGCRPAPARAPVGCGRDVDCKGPRVCVQGACVEPPSRSPALASAPPAPAPAPVAPPVAKEPPPPPPLPPAITLPGVSSELHVDWTHSGRSRFRVSTTTPREIARAVTAGTVYSSPAITDEGVAIFGSHDRAIRAVPAPRTPSEPDAPPVRLEPAWRHDTADLVWCSPALGPGGAAGIVYVGSDDDRLYALDARDGALRFTVTAGPCRRSVGVGPEAARCDVDGVTVGPDGTIYFVADGAYAIHPDGTFAFRFRLPTHCASTPAVAPDGTIYVGSDDHKLYAFSPNGSLRFALQTGGPVRSSPALAADGTIYVGSFDGSLYAIRPDGIVTWTFRTADRILSSPTVDAAGTILIGSEDDRLYALAPDGRPLWSVLLDGDVDATPAIGPDGTIWIGSDDKSLHAFR